MAGGSFSAINKGKARQYDDVRVLERRQGQIPVVSASASSPPHRPTPRQGQIVQPSPQSQPQPSSPPSTEPHRTHSNASPASASAPASNSSNGSSAGAVPASSALSSQSASAPASATSSNASQATSVSASSVSQSISAVSSSPSSSSSSMSLSDTIAAASVSPSPSSAPHRTLAGNTPIMVVLIVGSIVGASVVLFGLAWLCRRSNKRKSRRGKFYTGDWSPRSAASEFSFGQETTADLFGKRKNILAAMRPSPMPSLKPDIEAAGAATRQQAAAHPSAPSAPHYDFGTDYDLNILAPHKLHTPAVQAATPVGLTMTGSAPNANGRGWALFDQPLQPVHEAPSPHHDADDAQAQSVQEAAPPGGQKLFVVNASSQQSSSSASPRATDAPPTASRRPTFIQRLLDQPDRASNVNLNSRILDGEKCPSPQQPTATAPASRQHSTYTHTTNNQNGNGIMSAFSSMRLLGKSGGAAVAAAAAVATAAAKSKGAHAAAADDSDFEGTIGAPDKELPRATRIKKGGQRFVCEETSASETESIKDVDIEDTPVLMAARRQLRPNGNGYLWFDGQGTPRTPGLAGVGASWARASAQLARYPLAPQAPQAVMSANVPGRQLLGAPCMPPPGARATVGTLAELKRQQALIDHAEQQQRISIPQAGASGKGDSRLDSRIKSWWNGSWDAEWPSPTASAAQQFRRDADPEALLSPRSKPSSHNVRPLSSSSSASTAVMTQESSPVTTIGWGSESEVATLRGEAEIKHWQRESLARAHADLVSMGSLRPAAAAANSPLPQGSRSPTSSNDAAQLSERDVRGYFDGHESNAEYEGSLKTPVESREPLDFAAFLADEADAQDVVTFPVSRTGSYLSQPHSEHPSEDSLPSYRTNDAPSPTMPDYPAKSFHRRDSSAKVTERGGGGGGGGGGGDRMPVVSVISRADKYQREVENRARHQDVEARARATRKKERRAARKQQARMMQQHHAAQQQQHGHHRGSVTSTASSASDPDVDWPLDAALQARSTRQTHRHRRRREGAGAGATARQAPQGYESEATSASASAAAAADVLVAYCTPVLSYQGSSESSPATAAAQ